MNSVRIVTPPSIFPITLKEAKAWCKVVLPDGDTREDTSFKMLLGAMARHAEHLTGRAFCERTLEYSADCFGYEVFLPQPPLIEVQAIYYSDTLDVEQIVDPAIYLVDLRSEPGRVKGASGKSWPTLGTGYNPVRYRYRAGYLPPESPPDPDSEDRSWIPEEVRLWIQQRIVTIYNNREVTAFGFHTTQEFPRSQHDALLDSLMLGDRRF